MDFCACFIEDCCYCIYNWLFASLRSALSLMICSSIFMSWSNLMSSLRFCVTSFALKIDAVWSLYRRSMPVEGGIKSWLSISCDTLIVFDTLYALCL